MAKSKTKSESQVTELLGWSDDTVYDDVYADKTTTVCKEYGPEEEPMAYIIPRIMAEAYLKAITKAEQNIVADTAQRIAKTKTEAEQTITRANTEAEERITQVKAKSEELIAKAKAEAEEQTAKQKAILKAQVEEIIAKTKAEAKEQIETVRAAAEKKARVDAIPSR